ncbi:chloride channel protein [Maridesulfovibrio salexigens]|uniref:Chloride channel core n=1 Tax=Maridesulfovibrio salexigens (strain ATCC 14822 / DSM 2638 / NCIMB 8403 / VKM B-1763) TaxID=526222 RepID=C6C168_MARSD|nr:chloride channel protein [Maridesulfovibrio salexigens]ACS79231.1 Chloride channel core [Maridesulfovibrio salexigens DSM 2638]
MVSPSDSKTKKRTGTSFNPRVQYVLLMSFSVAIGMAAAGGAFLFRWLIENFQHFFWASGNSFLDMAANSPWWLVLFLPCIGGLIAGVIITNWAPEAQGPGVPEVIKALAVRGGVIRHRITFLKALATSLLIGCGASVGREGPVVQIGASLGSSAARIFRLDPSMLPVCVASGAAAGIAATFNAPLTGTLFAIEILLLDTEMSYVSHIIVASVTASALSKFFWGDFPTFDAPKFIFSNFEELIIFFLLGILAGLVSIAFVKMIRLCEFTFDQIPVPGWVKPGLGGLILGAIALKIPAVLGVGYEAVNMGLTGVLPLDLAIILLGAKLVATSLCIGSGMSGGIFAPSLVLGAALGVSVSSTINMIFPELALTHGQYALVGMGTVVAGTTLAPITAVLTVFELTYSYKIILPMMVGCITSALVVRILKGYSVYEAKLLRQGINILRGHDESVMVNIPVQEVMETDFDYLCTTDSLRKAAEMVLDSEFPHFPVLNKDNKLAGILTLRDMRAFLKNAQDLKGGAEIVDTLMVRTVVSLPVNSNLKEAIMKFERTGVSFLPLVNQDETVAGIIKSKEAMNIFRKKRYKNKILSSSI